MVFILNIACVLYGLSPRCHKDNMSSDTYQLVVEAICSQFPLTPVHCRSECPIFPNSLPLKRTATFFEYVVIGGKRYHASCAVGTNKSSFAHVIIPGPSLANIYGEVLEFIQVNQQIQQNGRPLWFIRMQWFKAWASEHEQL